MMNYQLPRRRRLAGWTDGHKEYSWVSTKHTLVHAKDEIIYYYYCVSSAFPCRREVPSLLGHFSFELSRSLNSQEHF